MAIDSGINLVVRQWEDMPSPPLVVVVVVASGQKVGRPPCLGSTCPGLCLTSPDQECAQVTRHQDQGGSGHLRPIGEL